MITLRDYQDAAEQSIWSHFASGKRTNPLIALPTATGKSLVIGKFAHNALTRYPATRILIATHIKELLTQNSQKLAAIWPSAPFGIFSAGLGQRETNLPIIFAGIASAVKSLELLGRFDILMVDEAHLMSGKDESMYGTLIAHLRRLNPALRIIRFTATKYRMGQGLLTEIDPTIETCFDMTTMRAINWLIEQGYLAMPIPKRTTTQLDISKVDIVAGEFNKKQLEDAVDVKDTNYLACKETVELGSNRECWLAFASSVKHAEHLAENFNYFGVPTIAVHSKMGEKKRDEAIAQFKAGNYRCLVNKGIFTTGHDHPPIDLIADLAPTMSTALHVQKIGRGMRPHPGKNNVLCLDFAGNVPRLGPVNDPVLPRRKGSGVAGVAPIRICEACGTYNHASARICYVCGLEFPANPVALNATAGTDEIIRQEEKPELVTFNVTRVTYGSYRKNSIALLKVFYICGLKTFEEVVCLEHSGYAKKKAWDWWRQRMGTEVAPPTVEEALRCASKLAVPKAIVVHVNRQFPVICAWEF